jgi:surface polysaccharide O-acyltransferase-like enzyme
MRNKDNNLNWVKNLRVLATISVIVLHTASVILYQYGTIASSVWWIGNVYDSAVRFCVPVFLMLTGTLLLNKEYELYDFLKNRFSRIILPFLFWSLIYAFLALKNKFLENPELSFFEICRLTFLLFKNGASFHLWYVYMIIGIYLFIPILNKWIKNATEKEILYFILIWIVTLFFNQPIVSRARINIDMVYFSGYIGYVVLGYYLSIKSFRYNVKNIRFIAIALIITGIAIAIFGTYFLTKRANHFMEYFYSNFALNTIISSVGMFLLFKNLKISNQLLIRIIDFINKYSYGIYLVHVLVLEFLKVLGITYNFINPILAIPIITILCLCISSFIIFGINKLPYGKHISG